MWLQVRFYFELKYWCIYSKVEKNVLGGTQIYFNSFPDANSAPMIDFFCFLFLLGFFYI